jgi:DNA-binding transcriptional ArsR family regulator
MAAGTPRPAGPAPREAGDVIAFGQESGRVLSDGRIVGRAEPFAKVLPSSRAVKRAVGLMAWAVLDDIALDARIDDRGRLVAETTSRRLAKNLGLNKDTVSKHLGRLREHGFVFQEESREVASGRWEPCRLRPRQRPPQDRRRDRRRRATHRRRSPAVESTHRRPLTADGCNGGSPLANQTFGLLRRMGCPPRWL